LHACGFGHARIVVPGAGTRQGAPGAAGSPTREENPLSILIVATISPRPGRADAVREALVAAIPAVHQEAGCELYALHEDGYGFVMIERWATQDDVKAHGAGTTFNHLSEQVKEDLSEPIGVRLISPVPAGDPAKGAL
jgi:quinol monooxygenase YgiN